MFTLQIGNDPFPVERLSRTCSRQVPDEWEFILPRGPQTAGRAGLPHDAKPGDDITLIWHSGKIDLRLLGWKTSPKHQGIRTVLASLIRQSKGVEALPQRVWQGHLTALLAPKEWVKIEENAALALQHISLHLCRPAGSQTAVSDARNLVLADILGWLEHEADVPLFLAAHSDGGLVLRAAADLTELPFRPASDRIADSQHVLGWGGPAGPPLIDEEWQTPLEGPQAVDAELIEAPSALGRSGDSAWTVVWWRGTWSQSTNGGDTLLITRRWQGGIPSHPNPPHGSGWLRLARMLGYKAQSNGGGAPVAEVQPFDYHRGKLVALTDEKHPLSCRLLTPYAGQKGDNCGVHFVPENGAIVAVATPSVFVWPTLLGEVREAACSRNGFGIFLPSDHSFDLTGGTIRISAKELKVSAESEICPASPPAAKNGKSDEKAGSDATPAPPKTSREFKLAMISGLSAGYALKFAKYLRGRIGAGVAVDGIFFQIWDTKNNQACIYFYGGGGLGVGFQLPWPHTVTTHGDWNPFTTTAEISCAQFGGLARFTSAGVGCWSINWINLTGSKSAVGADEVYMRISTGCTIGAGASSTLGEFILLEGPGPFTGREE